LALAAGSVLLQRSELEVLALARTDPVPQTRELVGRGRYAEAAEYLGFFMDYDYVRSDPAAQTLEREIAEVRGSPRYLADQLAEGLATGTSDELAGLTLGIATDFLAIGDIRDLANQGFRWSRGEAVDETIAALSAIGLAATGAQLASAGAATPAKGGVALLKLARKTGKLPPWLGKALVDGAASVRRTGRLDAVTGLLGDSYRLARHAGIVGGLRLLGTTRDPASLARTARFAETFGERSAVLYRIGGDAALFAGARAAELGAESVRLAATFGAAGLKALDKVGAIRFVKYASRTARVSYKGDWLRPLARYLADLPDWLLALVMLTGILGSADILSARRR
jgi:hypothetical protein